MLMRTTKETIPWQMFTLRDGSEVLVRKATPKDTEGLFGYRDTAGPILKEAIRIEDGQVRVPEGPGIGLEWDEEAVSRFLIR